ncbi:MAG: hypothetical protein H7A20_00140 [Rhodanobacteraceae bacterium]|nr:hypothetical protein [Rhodanobacteraceae bacterium]HPF74031.1 hypothetical protein [Xanthomonadaceae bacterium]HRX99769.1 hypothetical protein [Xanthomonadaceae bacterium]
MAESWPFLALILFLPCFLVLGGIYLWVARRRRRWLGVDLLVLLLATAFSMVAMHWGFASADRHHGNMWPQVFATLLAYGAFIAVMAVALPLRLRSTARTG